MQLYAKRGLRREAAPFRTLEHCTYRSENLAELIVQLPRNGAKRLLLNRDQLSREIALLARKGGQAFKKPAVGVNQVEACEQDSDKHRRDEVIDVSFHPRIDVLDLLCGLLLGFIVRDQYAGDRGSESRLLCSQ